MSSLKPYQRIASRFQISQESAKYFLNHVQKSFKTQRPNHQIILDFIEAQEIELLLAPYEVATMMYESGAWAHDLVAPPPMIVNDEDYDDV